MAKKGFTDADVPDQAGRCFLVTGANTGLGFEISRILASRGARVLLACRNQIKTHAAINKIRKTSPQADLIFLPIDQADLASVRRAAEIASSEQRLDVLINNAGIMSTHTGFTSDGFEHHFGVNHLGTFALTLLLLPKLATSSDARVVVTSSLVHKNGNIDFDNIERGENVKPGQLYANSKLANLLFMSELDRRLRVAGSGIKAVGCHPGLAATELSRDMPAFVRALSPILSKLVNTPLQGAWPTLQAACDPEIEAGGYYGPQQMGGTRGPSGPAKQAPRANSENLAEKLWDLSEKLTGVHFPD